MKTLALLAALLMGARVVWMPTQDAHTQQQAGLPSLRTRCPGLPTVSYTAHRSPPRRQTVSGSSPSSTRCSQRGHLGPSECDWLLDEAKNAGVQRVLVTHAGWVVPSLDEDLARRLASRGALLEITAYQLTGSHPMPATTLARFARGVGLQSIVLSSDAGQAGSALPPEALGALIEALAREGLPETALVHSASALPRDLVTP